MIKKIILSFLLFLNMLYAAELMSKAQYIKHEDVRIHFTNMTGQNQDWIGIYRDGTNNDWKNVIKWAWTKDISEGKLTFKGLKLGLYEARAFYNNSYKVETEKKFSVVGN